MEVLEPVRYGEESMVPDRTNIASTENPLDVWDPALDTDPEGRKQYRELSLKVAYWYDNVFLGAPDDEEEYEDQDYYDPDEIDYLDTDGED